MKKARSFKLAMGGKTKGPSHKEGGIEAKVGEKPVAEVEGGERVFSQDDTAFIEQEVEKIKGYMETNDIPGADNCAKDLGYAVAKMVSKQDMNEMRDVAETDAINSFENGEDY